jgi:hypothetical protein
MGHVKNKKENKHGCVCTMIGDGHEYKIVKRFFLLDFARVHLFSLMQEDLFGVSSYCFVIGGFKFMDQV